MISKSFLYKILILRDKASYISQEKFDLALATIPELKIRKWLDIDIVMMFKIMYFCALRPGEAIKLKKEDFDIESREVYLGKTKTHKEDYAVIPTVFCAELQMWLHEKKDGRLYENLTYDTAYRWFKRLGEICDIPAWTISQSQSGEKTVGHIFRKTIGKDMLNGKFGEQARQIPVISKMMRHSKTSMTTDYYLKVGAESVKEAL